MSDGEGFVDVSEEEMLRIDEELDEQEELDRARRWERRRALVVPVLVGLLLVATFLWAVSGAVVAILFRESLTSERLATFAQRATQVYGASRAVAYASLFALGGLLIAKLLGRTWPGPAMSSQHLEPAEEVDAGREGRLAD
jgi:hypothetical protein